MGDQQPNTEQVEVQRLFREEVDRKRLTVEVVRALMGEDIVCAPLKGGGFLTGVSVATHAKHYGCEDDLSDKAYFDACYKEACEITAYLCKMYNIDPRGTVEFKGVTVPTILCHWDSYKLGLGSGHGDVYSWFNRYGKDMDDVRNDVAALMDGMSAGDNDTNMGDDFMTKEQILKEIGDQYITTFDELPSWAKSDMRQLLDEGYINGGTSAAVDPDDINMFLSDIKAIIVTKRMIGK